MMWWLVVFASAGLIALGTGLLVRDLFLSRSDGARQGKHGHDADAAPKSSKADAPAAASRGPAAIPGEPGSREPASSRTGRPFARSTALEQQWSRLTHEIEAAVGSVNRSFGQLSITIGSPGQPTWNLDNDGFGDYRRVRIEQESVAWLRLELARDLSIRSRLRTHEAQFSDLNRDAETTSERSADELALAIRNSLAGIFDFAVKRHSDLLRHEAATTGSAPTTPPRNAAAQVQNPTGIQKAEAAFAPLAPAKPSAESMPSPSAALVDAAVSLVNRAFAEADAKLIPADSKPGAKAFSDRTLSILAANRPVGYMLIEPRSDRIDISVGLLDQTSTQSIRKKSQPMSGLTLHALAEAIATQAWPAIAAASTRTAVA